MTRQNLHPSLHLIRRVGSRRLTIVLRLECAVLNPMIHVNQSDCVSVDAQSPRGGKETSILPIIYVTMLLNSSCRGAQLGK